MSNQSKKQEKKSYNSTIDQLIQEDTPAAKVVKDALKKQEQLKAEKEAEVIINKLNRFEEVINHRVQNIREYQKAVKQHRKSLKDILKQKDEYLLSIGAISKK